MKLDNINLCVIVVIEQEAVKMNINKFTQKSTQIMKWRSLLRIILILTQILTQIFNKKRKIC